MKIKPSTIIEYGLIFLIVFTPLAFGSVHVWAYTIVEVVVLLLLLTHLFSRLAPRSSNLEPQVSSSADSSSLIAKNHEPRATSHEPFSSPLAPNPSKVKSETLEVIPHSSPFTFYTLLSLLFLGLVLFQMVPLPAAVIKHLSPNTHALYEQTLGNPLKVKSETLEVAPHSSRFTFHASRPLSIYRSATKNAFLKFFVYFSVFFLIAATVTTARQIRRIALTVIFTGAGVAFLALCQMLSKSDKIYGFWQSQYKAGSYGGPFINPNHLAGYLEMVIPLTLGFLISREVPAMVRAARNWKQRLSLLESWLAKNILLIFIVVLMASALFISASRGGILCFVFSLGLFSLLLGLQKSHRGKRKIIALIFGLFLVFVLWLGVDPVVTKFAIFANPNPRTASGERPQVWENTLSLARDFPVFGVGLGNYQTLFPRYKTIATRILWEHAHNDYVEMLADTGWVGLFLFFGGIWFLLFFIIKKWRQRRDPFPAGITLGCFIGAISLLCHSLVEFNFHIPAVAFLFFVTLGLGTAAVHVKRRGDEEFSLLAVPRAPGSPKKRTALIMIKALAVIFLLAVVMKDYLAYHFFTAYQSLGKETVSRNEDQNLRIEPRTSNLEPRASILVPLHRAVFFDSGNAQYHYELGNYFAKKMSDSWQQGAWTREGERWVFSTEENTGFFGLKALQAYADAVNLSPANAWYHFYLGWTLSELKRFSDFAHKPVPLSEPGDAATEFSRALMLDPNNQDIKNYIAVIKGKRFEERGPGIKQEGNRK